MTRTVKARGGGLGALEILMRPLVRFCLRRSGSIQDFYSTAKKVFVEIALAEMHRSGTEPNVSRVSVMTGLNRADVTRLMRSTEEISDTGPLSLLAKIVGLWRQGKAFTTQSGEPKVLTADGKDSDFFRLVSSVSKTISPGTVLFELRRLGYIEESRRGVRLLRQVLSVQREPVQGFELLAHEIETLMASVEENLTETNEITNLHIRTEYDNIFASDLPAIRRWLVDEGKEFHRRAREFISRSDKDVNAGRGEELAGERVVLTAFSWTTKGVGK